MASFTREADKRMLKDIFDKLEDARRQRHYSYAILASRAQVSIDTCMGAIFQEKGTIKTFTRLVDALDYDIVLVKRQKIKRLLDIPGAEEQMNKIYKNNYKAKLKDRANKRSLKEEFEQAEFEQDFLNT